MVSYLIFMQTMGRTQKCLFSNAVNVIFHLYECSTQVSRESALSNRQTQTIFQLKTARIFISANMEMLVSPSTQGFQIFFFRI